MEDFAGRTAVITGAASGIGAALARRAAAEGMNVVLADIRLDDAARVAADLDPNRTLAVQTDVADERSVAALADAAWDRFGSVDLLCNNAGVVPGGRHRRVWELDTSDWKWALGVNLYGIVHGIRCFVPRMLEAGRPAHIMNTTSVVGFISGAGSTSYSASKHAAVRVTEALYAELRETGAPIGVTMLVPGLVATNIRNAEQFRPEHLKVGANVIEESHELKAASEELYRAAMRPETAADIAFRGIMENRFYVFTSEAFDPAIRSRIEAVLARANPRFESVLAMSKTDSLMARES